MKWKILTGLDIAFSTLAIIAAGVLGNSLIANHVPRLHDNPTWLSRLVMTSLTAPDALADWALGALPTVSILMCFTMLVAAESLLVLLTPLVDRALAVAAADKYQQDLRSTYHEVLRNRESIRSLKHRMLRRVILRLSAMSLLAFTVGLMAGAIAWGVALLINANTGGVIQASAVVAGIAALLFLYSILKEIVPAAVEEENDGLDRFGELPRSSALPLRWIAQRPWRVVALALFIIGSIVVVFRLAQRQQEPPVREIEGPISTSQPATAGSSSDSVKPAPPAIPAVPTASAAVPQVGSFVFLGEFSNEKYINAHFNPAAEPRAPYRVELWKDRKVGIVGHVFYPVREADSPVARIKNATLDDVSGKISFQARLWAGNSFPENQPQYELHVFTGFLKDGTLRGAFSRQDEKMRYAAVKDDVTLKNIASDEQFRNIITLAQWEAEYSSLILERWK